MGLRMEELIKKAAEDGMLLKLLPLIFTPNELDQFKTRLEIIKGLLQKNETHRELSERLKVGIANITRGSNELKRQSEDLLGFLLAFFAMEEKK